ncbi:hypothetical protein [Aureibaculum luteum]|uniref:hypothetical protein n=1 Tax=Aureibaculum luteum TaxID=1548456 RepID=UPI000E4B082C|nr:hypothetical protein [Aureibaculum luteum]
MKPKVLKLKTILVCMGMLLCYSQHTNAQFFKKLKKRAEEAAKEAVLRKSEEKAATETEKGMDKLFNFDFSKKSMDPSILPESYDFEWKYKLQMKSKSNQGEMDIVYNLKSGANYFGFKPVFKEKKFTDSIVMVMDEDLKTMTIFRNSNDIKTGYIISTPVETAEDVAQEEELMKEMNYKELDTKEILGYTCQGFQIENKEIKMIMYVTFDAPVSFNQIYNGANKKALPEGFDPKWLKGADNSLMMEMTFINKKKKKFNTTMTCVELVNEPMSIIVSDYDFRKLNAETAEGDY